MDEYLVYNCIDGKIHDCRALKKQAEELMHNDNSIGARRQNVAFEFAHFVVENDWLIPYLHANDACSELGTISFRTVAGKKLRDFILETEVFHYVQGTQNIYEKGRLGREYYRICKIMMHKDENEPDPITLDTTIEDLYGRNLISVRLINTLHRSKLYTVGDVVCLTYDEVMKIRLMGPGTAKELIDLLENAGFEFAGKNETVAAEKKSDEFRLVKANTRAYAQLKLDEAGLGDIDDFEAFWAYIRRGVYLKHRVYSNAELKKFDVNDVEKTAQKAVDLAIELLKA